MTDRSITTIAFDADDTLWHNERIFKETEARFCQLLGDFAPQKAILQQLLDSERRNIALYGFGIKGFTLSMIETALTASKGEVAGAVLMEIIAMGKAMLAHPVEIFAGVEATLRQLSHSYQLFLITKGDLFDQERKIELSGLSHYFRRIEIVSEKNAATYRRIFDEHAHGVRRAVMVGNSLKSDVLAAIEAGAHGIHVPHEHEWELEKAVVVDGQERFYRVTSIGEIAELIDGF